MALTVPHSFTSNTVAEAAEVNANNTAIKSFVDALQAGTNITAQAIATAAIADSAITAVKIAAGVITAAKIDASFSSDDQIILATQVFG